MPWDADYFPRSRPQWPPGLRGRAIAMADALLQQGYEQDRAIRIASAPARR